MPVFPFLSAHDENPICAVQILQPVVFSADGRKLISGIWKESPKATACGVERTHNILTTVRANDGALMRSNQLPGTSHADIVLQTDAARMLYDTISKIAEAGCDPKQYFISDTTFRALDPSPIPNALAGPTARAWTEEWSAMACTKPVRATMTFSPDATGTAIKVALPAKK